MPPPFRTILVLCEGNHCRSPLAEVLLRKALPEEVQVLSAGLRALVDVPADSEIRRLAASVGAPLEDHRGCQVDAALALSADLILVMDEAQRHEFGEGIPVARGRIFLLGHWLEPDRREIPDPHGRDLLAMSDCLQHIQEAVAAWLPRLTSG